MSCLCSDGSLLNPVQSGVCLAGNSAHWVCSACAPKYICSKHSRRCLPTFNLWSKTAGVCASAQWRSCALGCVNGCVPGRCKRTRLNCDVVLQDGSQFRSFQVFRQYVSARSNVVMSTVKDFHQSLLVFKTEKSFGSFKAMSLFLGNVTGAAILKIQVKVFPPMFGPDMHVVFELTARVPCTKTYVSSSLKFDRVECNGSDKLVDILRLTWPNCILQLLSVSCTVY